MNQRNIFKLLSLAGVVLGGIRQQGAGSYY